MCLTRRLVIASKDRQHIAGVVARLTGERSASLADDSRFVRTCGGGAGGADGGAGLLSFYGNAEPLKPMIRMALEQERRTTPARRWP